MTLQMTIDNDQGTIFFKRTGEMNPDELKKCIKNFKSNPDFSEVNKVLYDVSSTEFSYITCVDIRSYALNYKAYLDGIKVAVIASGDVSFGLSRMFEAFSNNENILITKTMSEAMAWLGVYSSD